MDENCFRQDLGRVEGYVEVAAGLCVPLARAGSGPDVVIILPADLLPL